MDVFKALNGLRAALDKSCSLKGLVAFESEDVRTVVQYLDDMGAKDGLIGVYTHGRRLGSEPQGFNAYLHDLLVKHTKTRAEYKIALIGRMPPPGGIDPDELENYLRGIDKMAEILVQQDLDSVNKKTAP